MSNQMLTLILWTRDKKVLICRVHPLGKSTMKKNLKRRRKKKRIKIIQPLSLKQLKTLFSHLLNLLNYLQMLKKD